VPVEPEPVRRRRRSAPVIIVVLVAVVIVMAAGIGAVCVLRPDDEPEVSMSHPLPALSRGDRGPVRHDLEPLVKRFGALGSPRGATWQGGTLGSDRVPGPSTYWIEAVVQLEPGTAHRLVEANGGAPVPPPQIDGALTPALTAGPWAASEPLDGAFRAEGFRGRAFVDEAHDTLVLLLVGGPN
jgi:hypothetical protein